MNKFEGRNDPRSENGVRYLTDSCNAFLSGKVLQTVDCGTHTLFIADVTQAQVLCTVPSVTYAYYFDNIKPKPRPKAEDKPKRGYVCKISAISTRRRCRRISSAPSASTGRRTLSRWGSRGGMILVFLWVSRAVGPESLFFGIKRQVSHDG